LAGRRRRFVAFRVLKSMDEKEKKYIEEIFKYVRTDGLLIINSQGHLQRLVCPFGVLVIRSVHSLIEGDIEAVIAVKIGPGLIDVYLSFLVSKILYINTLRFSFSFKNIR